MYNYIKFIKDFISLRRQAASRPSRFPIKWRDRYPCLNDNTATTGFDAHYIYHLAWAARILAQTRPEGHVDISSSLHFCSLISAFMPLKFYDFRPANLHLEGLSTASADLMALPFLDREIQSLSCMHVVEHIGLGRYGDCIDPDGDLKAISELQRVVAISGSLLFVVPIGKPRIQFNAHRIYSFDQILQHFRKFELKEFSLITDNPVDQGIVYHASKDQADAQKYGCGCFWFVRRQP